MGAKRPDTTSLALVHRVTQTETDQQDDRQKLISKIVRAMLYDFDKESLNQELHQSRRNVFLPIVEEELLNM